MCFREYDLPYGLYVSLCTLRVAVTSFHATLGMGGWLSLTQPGLPPGKNAPSLLGALTFRRFARCRAISEVLARRAARPAAANLLLYRSSAFFNDKFKINFTKSSENNFRKVYRNDRILPNSLESLNEEVRRRERVIRIFPNDQSSMRLVDAVLMKKHEQWINGRRYLCMDQYWEWKKDQQKKTETDKIVGKKLKT